MRDYQDDVRAMHESRPALAGTLATLVTLEHVLNWMQREGLPLASLDMVTQDEYCHDLLVPLGPDWLVFGMT